MTELLQQGGHSLMLWVQRHMAAIISVVFAMGFAWSQFSAVQVSLTETRRELAELHQAFVAFRVSGVGATSEELAATVARQRDTDLRQDEDLKFLRDRMIAMGEQLQRLLAAKIADASERR